MLEVNQHLAVKVFENSLDGIYITDVEGKIIQVNRAFCDITGYFPAQVIGRKPSTISAGWHDINFLNDIQPALTEFDHWEGELLSRRSDGEAFLVWMSISAIYADNSEFQGLITSFKDITEVKNSEENIRQLAYYDPLTDLPNRTLFNDRLSQALRRAQRSRQYVAMLFLDLDGFKAVNDNLGHAIGDRLLTQVAVRLGSCIRNDDTVARMGGDEFTIILHALSDKAAAESASAKIANKVIDELNRPFKLQSDFVNIGASIGIALYPDDAAEQSVLIKQADTAMYHAKSAGKNNYQFFTEDMHKRVRKRQEVERTIVDALANNEFVLNFQPKFDISNMKIKGFEALLRWQHPQQGKIMPVNFMRSIDDLDLGSEVGEWVITQVCRQIKQWQQQGLSIPNISINVFIQHFRNGGVAESVAKALKEMDIKPQLLTLEISEALVNEDIAFAYMVFSELKALGVRISIDDFATGLTALHYINSLPIDELKIDRRFIQNIDKDPNQWPVVDAIIKIASSFGCDVVAEGIERQQQLNLLRRASCLCLQGFLFSQAIAVEEVELYMQRYLEEELL